MRSVNFNNDKIQIKSAWNELTRDEALLLAKASLKSWSFFYTAFVLFLKMTGLKLRKPWRAVINNREAYCLKRSRQVSYNITAIDMTYILNKRLRWPFNFIADEKTKIERVNVNSLLTKNLIPKFRAWFKTNKGPADGLTNISYNEFVFAETNYLRFIKSKDPLYLRLMLAVLYRPRKSRFVLFVTFLTQRFGGDFRKPFNPYFIEKRAKRFKSVKQSKLLVMLWFYQGCRALLHKKFAHLFQEGDGSNADVFESFMDLSNAATGGDPSRLEKIKSQNLWEVLKKLDTDVKSAEKLKSKSNG